MGTDLALRPDRSRKTEILAPSNGPSLRPPRDLDPPKKVVIEDGLWADLQRIANFHTAAFEKMGSKDKANRTEIVDNFLRWAKEQFWEARGGEPTWNREGEPTNAADYDRKVSEFKLHLEKQAQLEKKAKQP